MMHSSFWRGIGVAAFLILLIATADAAAPVAGFTADVVSGLAPLSVTFTDTSTGSPTAWAWDFDGDTVADSTDQSPSHEYAEEGNYTVTLQVSNAEGTDLETKTNYIYVGPLTARMLRASFSYTKPVGTAPFSVTFTDTSASNGTYVRNWDFGDGDTSTEANPVHEYSSSGKYDVKLIITSDHTSDSSAARKAIMAYPVEAVSPLPTTTFGAHMTEIMESNWNVSVIGPIIPRAYTDVLTPLTGNTGVGDMIFWGIIWVGVFMILFLRQGTPWLAALVGLVAGPGILTFLPPEWAHVGYICLAVTIGCSFFVIALGRFRST
jgi:PKD repeat protein